MILALLKTIAAVFCIAIATLAWAAVWNLLMAALTYLGVAAK